MPSAAAFLDAPEAPEKPLADPEKTPVAHRLSASDFLDAPDEPTPKPRMSAAEFLDDKPATGKTSAGFLSDILHGMADLGRADAAATTQLGHKAAAVVRGDESIHASLANSEAKYGLRPGLLSQIAQTESRLDPKAVSPAGAQGLMQFMPSTAKQYGIDPFDPHQAADAGGQHVKYLLDRYNGDESKALAAYNWGEGNLDRALKKSGPEDWRARLPAETYAYLSKVQGAKAAGLPKELNGLPVSPALVDEVRKLYDARNPKDRAELLARDDTTGRVARAVDAEAKRFDETRMGQDPQLRAILGGRLEDRALGYKLQGVDTGTALSLASSDVAADLGPQTLRPAEGEPMGVNDQAIQATKRGVVGLQQIGAGLGAWASDVLGDEQHVQGFMQDYQDLEDEARSLPAEVETLKDIHSGEDAAKWAVNAIYSNLPMMLPSLASGGVTGLTARAAAKRTFAGLAEQFGEEKAAQMVASRIAKAAATGAGASSVGMETGAIYSDIRQQTGEGRPGLALAAGVPAGILDTLPDMMVLQKMLGPAASRQVAGGLVARFGLPIAKQMLAEGATEGAQEAIERGAASIASGQPFLTAQTRDGIIEAMAQGAVAGGVMGGGSEVAPGLKPVGDGYAKESAGTDHGSTVGVADNTGGTPAVDGGTADRGGLLPDDGAIGTDGRTADPGNALEPNEPDRPLSEESIAGRAGLTPAAPTARVPRSRDKPIKEITSDDTLLSAIAKLGGLDMAEAEAQGIDTPYLKGRTAIKGHGIFKVFTGTGQSFDKMAENLRQYGFQVDGPNTLLEQIGAAINAKERGHETDLEKLAADQADTAQQMEQARELESLSPGFELAEDEYTPEMDDQGRHMHELATALNHLEDGAGDAIIEREAIQGKSNDHTIQTLTQALSARNRPGETAGKPGQGPQAQATQLRAPRAGTPADTQNGGLNLENTSNTPVRDEPNSQPLQGKMGAVQAEGKTPSPANGKTKDLFGQEGTLDKQDAAKLAKKPEGWAEAEALAQKKWAVMGKQRRLRLLKSYRQPEHVALYNFNALPEQFREDLTVSELGAEQAKEYGNLLKAAAEAKTLTPPVGRDDVGELLAPNGKPSKLNAMQWNQVRSPQFKAEGQAAKAVRKALGSQGRALEDAGLLRIVQTQREVPGAPTRPIQGYYDKGIAWLVADYLAPGREMGVLLHEVGEHASLETMLGPKLYGKLAEEAERLYAEGGEVARQAQKIMPPNTPTKFWASERIAYLIEFATHADEAQRKTLPGRLRLLIGEALAAIRAWFWRSDFARTLENKGIKLNLTERDLAALARAAVRALVDEHLRMDKALPEGAQASFRGDTKTKNNATTAFSPLDPNAARQIGVNLKDLTFQDIQTLSAAQIKGLRSIGLPLLGRRQIVDLYAEDVPEIRVYDHLMQAYGADSNELQHKAGELVADWGKLGREVSDRLADLMHLATAHAVDVSAPKFVPSWDGDKAQLAYQEELAAARKEKNRLQILIKGMPGSPKRELWDKLKEVNAQLDKLSRPWSERTYVKRKKKNDAARELAWRQLHPRYEALPAKAKAVYTQARDMYQKQWTDVEQALAERIERSNASEEQKAKNIASLRLMFRKELPEIYFPLFRAGDYVLVVKDKDNKNEAVLFAESLPQAEMLKKELAATYAGTDKKVMPIGKKAEKGAQEMVSAKFVSDVLDILGTQEGGPSLDGLREQIMQMYLEALPDLSWAKHEIHRKNRKGYSRDARRAFASHMAHGAAHLSRIRYVDQLETALEEMQKGVNEHKYDEGYDAVRAQEVVNEMRKRHEVTMNPPNAPWANRATSLGFVWYMGLSPASAMVNLSQTPMVAYPVLAGDFGFRKSALELTKASADVSRALAGGFDVEKGKEQMAVGEWLSGAKTMAGVMKSERQLLLRLAQHLKPGELAAIKRGIEEGHLTVTLAHELAGVAQGNERGATSEAIMTAASYMFHVAELFNRMATLLAAYRLAKAKGYNDEGAYNKAVDLTYDGHFDYSANNRPRAMAGPWARVFLLFKQYAQNMTYTFAKNGVEALAASKDFMRGRPIAEKRKAAAKTFAGLMVMHGTIAGALGLPMGTTLLAAASMLWGDDDEPFDAEVALRNYLANATSPAIAEALVHGLPRAARQIPGWKHIPVLGNADMAGRVGLDHLWFPDIQEGLEGEKWYQAMAMAALGPVPGVGLSFAKGLQDIAEGHTAKGVESLMPKTARDILKAMRYQREGVKDKTGIEILDNTSIAEELSQAAGFSPARVMEAYEARGAIYNQDRRLTDRRGDLLEKWSQAALEKDEAAKATAKAAIDKFNKANPSLAINGEGMLRSVLGKRGRIDKAKGGVYLSPKKAGLRDLGGFADVKE